MKNSQPPLLRPSWLGPPWELFLSLHPNLFIFKTGCILSGGVAIFAAFLNSDSLPNEEASPLFNNTKSSTVSYYFVYMFMQGM